MKSIIFFALLLLSLSCAAQSVPTPTAVLPIRTASFVAEGIVYVSWHYEPTVIGRESATMEIAEFGKEPERHTVAVNLDLPGVTRFFCGERLYALHDSHLNTLTIFKDNTFETYAGR